MKMRWVAALLALSGLGTAGARADGFGFTVANVPVTNVKAAGNTDTTRAQVGDTFTVTGAPFASYRSSGNAPAILDNDLSRYSADINGTVTSVNGTVVTYTGTFDVKYTGPAYPTGTLIETGTLNLRATYDAAGRAVLTGVFSAGAGPVAGAPPPFNTTDFAPYNPGRFFAIYTPGATPAQGAITASLNAGGIGFAASLNNGHVVNGDTNGNGVADVGETWTLTAPVASYYTVGGPPLNDNDLTRYSVVLNGTVTSVVGTTVTYTGTFALRYTGPAYPSGVDVETGGFTMTAVYNEARTGAAKLTGQLIATPGIPTALQTDPNFSNSDYAIFNPATFNGTYVRNADGSGTASGSLIGGVLGFSTSIGDGTVSNIKKTGTNPYAEVGDQFIATGPLSTYLAYGAPPLTDRDLSRYSITINGTVTSVAGTTVTYDGTFTITYTGPALTTNIETGTASLIAVYGPDGAARLTGVLNAAPGPETTTPPFDTTDYSPFNPATFTGHYTPTPGDYTKGSFRGGLIGGTLSQPIQSRKLGAAIEGSPTAATDTADNRRAIVASGNTLYVLDPATGDDAPGWEGGKALNGVVFGRPAVLHDDVYVGTDTGNLYHFNLRTGAQVASIALGGSIITAPAVVDKAVTGLTQDTVVVVSRTTTSATVYKVAADLTPASVTSVALPGANVSSSPAVPYNGLIFVGTNAGLFTIRYSDLAIQNQDTTPAPTSPLVVGSGVYVGVGDGSTFQKYNVATGTEAAGGYPLGSPLVLSAFYEKRTNLIQAGTQDGSILSFNADGTFAGLTLPGLFNPSNSGGSFAMPVETNNIIYRATENNEIISGLPLNGDDQRTIATMTPVRGAVSATGQIPGADFIIGVAPATGSIHMIAVR